MRGRIILGLALACCGSVLCAQTTYYKWTDASGTVHFSDTPPASHQAQSVKVSDGSSAQGKLVPPPQNSAQDKEALAKAQAAYREQSCTAARNDLRVLSQGRMVVSGDNPDAATKLSVEQREQSKLRAQQRVTQFCGQGSKP